MCSGLGDLHEEASLEAVLYQKLMKGYSRRTRPVKDHSHHINITVQMILTQVVDLVSTNTRAISVNWFDKAKDVPLGCAMSQFVRVFPNYLQHKVGISANYFFPIISSIKFIIVTHTFG